MEIRKSNRKKYFDKCEFEEVMAAHVVCRFGSRQRFTSSSWPSIYLMSSQIKRCNGGKPDRDHFKILPPSCITADTSLRGGLKGEIRPNGVLC